MTEASSRTRRTMTGKVVSDRMDKTATVLIERKVPHRKYKKYIKLSTKLAVHDEGNQCKIGQHVKIEETRRMSKRKSWSVVDILER